MAQPKDHVSDLDRHMRLLDDKISKLRASLEHWEKWYWDYAELKEKVSELPTEPPPRRELARMRRDFESSVLSRKEMAGRAGG